MNLEDLYRLLRNGHLEAQGIIDTVPDPLLLLDQNLRVRTASRAFFSTFKVGHDDTIDEYLYDLGDGQWDIPELRRLLEEVIPKSAAVVDYEVQHDFPRIGRRTMLVSAHRLFRPENNSRFLLLSIVDATQQRKREAEQAVLLGEIRHRMKNLLALVQALARQTTAEGRSGEEYRDAFLGRFNTLVRAHDAAYAQEDQADLKEVLERTLNPYSESPGGILIEPGQPVLLEPGQVVSLSLVLHELATNAVKYGALSTKAGKIKIRWKTESASPPRLRLIWRESGGPRVKSPVTMGFGTRLVQFAVSQELRGRVELNYRPGGLVVEIVSPL
ncbi:HWE histidine kinase domain-containing protein (plasmid) [Ensifer adhaerens]|uniref:sensor histidine kinase n=1 Tax=Ensifer adhaerens TaxID=106592 RepID=UPI0023A9561A|nr:PAS domain-containing sensor histidine kinase [Ensifer adhaerens]WDZ81882.1 HWE histidine kinase domain-containing protein [Ensifer adhaerens]